MWENMTCSGSSCIKTVGQILLSYYDGKMFPFIYWHRSFSFRICWIFGYWSFSLLPRGWILKISCSVWLQRNLWPYWMLWPLIFPLNSSALIPWFSLLQCVLCKLYFQYHSAVNVSHNVTGVDCVSWLRQPGPIKALPWTAKVPSAATSHCVLNVIYSVGVNINNISCWCC